MTAVLAEHAVDDLWTRLGFDTADLVPSSVAEQAVLGVQSPRLWWLPEGPLDFSLGVQCVEWARTTLGVFLDPWECLVLRMMLARRPDGRWACPEFYLCLSRRNGKSHVLVIRFLFGLLVLGEEVAEYTAHHGKTVRTTFRLAWRILDKAPGSIPAWKPMKSAGREEIQFETGQSFAFSTRTSSAGRGTGGDTLAVDEAQEADDEEMDALAPILGDKSLSGNPQLIYAGSSGSFKSAVFGRARRRMLSGRDRRMGGAEWSIDGDAYLAADILEREKIATSVGSIAQANPALELRREDGSAGLSLEWLLGQVDVLSHEGFAREHLGVGTWPKDDGTEWVIPRHPWAERAKKDHPLPAGQMVLAVSGAWGFRSTSIAATVGTDEDCHSWLERMDRGTDWAVDEVVRLAKSRDTAAVMVDPGGPAAGLIPRIKAVLEPLGVPVIEMNGREMATACGDLLDAVTSESPAWSHRGQLEVTAALAGAKKKDLGAGLWLFDKAKSETDTAPLEALAWARFGWVQYGQQTTEAWGFVS